MKEVNRKERESSPSTGHKAKLVGKRNARQSTWKVGK